MGTNESNLFVPGSTRDAIYLAPLGTPLPTDLSVDPETLGFEHVGWLHTDGITETATGSKSEIRAHQGQSVVRTRIESPGTSFAFTALETKKQTTKLRYDEKSTTVAGGVRKTRRSPGQRVSARAAVIDLYDADFEERQERHVIEHVDITPNGDRVYAGTDIAGYPFLADIIGEYDTLSSLGVDDDEETEMVAPSITSVAPTSAAAEAEVTLTGVGFAGATQVRFGSANAAAFSVVSDTEITATVPAGPAGSAAVKVIEGTTESGTVAFSRTA